MRVLPINNNYIKYSANYDKKPQYISSVNFKGLFDSKPDIFELFQYGLQALDETSLFIASTNRENSNFALQRYKDKFDIPILKTYTLDVTRDLCKDWAHSNDRSLAIWKKDGDYYIIALTQLWGFSAYKGDFDRDTSFLKPGDVKKLESGMKIDVIDIGFGDKKLIFEPPRKYNTSGAEKYMDVKNTLNPQVQNSYAISMITKPKQSIEKTRKEFTFADIGGLDNIIEELKKFVLRPLKYPEVFENIRLNKGILLYGPPRCGKTLLCKALANEAGIPFKYMNANEFMSAEVGSSERRAREIFAEIDKKPSLLMIDEIDAIGKERGKSYQSHYSDNFLNQFLGLMSDLEKNKTMSFVIGATNRKDLLDKALIATGRFGLHLEVPLPDKKAIKDIYNIHAKNKLFEEDVKSDEFILQMFENKFNGSDIAECITLAYFNSLDRLGMNAKMDAGTFNIMDFKNIKIANADIQKAITKLIKQKI